MTASNKEEYISNVKRFFTPELTEKPMLFEIFTDSQDESDALKIMQHLETSPAGTAKAIAKGILGEKGVATVKKLLSK